MKNLSTKTYYVLDSGELDTIAIENGILDFNFLINQECKNDSAHIFNDISTISSWDDHSKNEKWGVEAQITKSIAEKESPSSGETLLWLCNKGIIPEGNYLIIVCW